MQASFPTRSLKRSAGNRRRESSAVKSYVWNTRLSNCNLTVETGPTGTVDTGNAAAPNGEKVKSPTSCIARRSPLSAGGVHMFAIRNVK
jgi:hypothetical protein